MNKITEWLLKGHHQWYRKEYQRVSNIMTWICGIFALVILVFLKFSDYTTCILMASILFIALGIIFTLINVDKHERKLSEIRDRRELA